MSLNGDGGILEKEERRFLEVLEYLYAEERPESKGTTPADAALLSRHEALTRFTRLTRLTLHTHPLHCLIIDIN